MSRLHRQKLRALARAGATPANRPDEISPALTSPRDAVGTVKPSRAQRPRRKAVRKTKAKAKKHK